MSPNAYFNMAAKATGFTFAFIMSAFLGQLLSRWYWAYKRSYQATKTATLNTYVYHKIATGPFLEYDAFDRKRPNLAM